MARTDNLHNYLTDIATAIKNKKGDTTPINASDFDIEITNLPSGSGEENVVLDTSLYTTGSNSLINMIIKMNLGEFDFSGKSSMANLFYGCKNLIELKWKPKNTSSITSLTTMFSECSNIKSISLNDIDTTNVTSFESTFYNCKKLESVDMSNCNMSNATTFRQIFYGCSVLKEVKANFDFTNATTIQNMFYNNGKINEVTICEKGKGYSNLLTSTGCQNLFYYCSELQKINNLEELNFPNATSLQDMFNGCYELKEINLSGMVNDKISNMQRAFISCYELEKLHLDNIDLANVSNTYYTFQSCGSRLSNNQRTKVYVKNEASRNKILSLNYPHRPSTWDETNIIIAGSAEDDR